MSLPEELQQVLEQLNRWVALGPKNIQGRRGKLQCIEKKGAYQLVILRGGVVVQSVANSPDLDSLISFIRGMSTMLLFSVMKKLR